MLDRPPRAHVKAAGKFIRDSFDWNTTPDNPPVEPMEGRVEKEKTNGLPTPLTQGPSTWPVGYPTPEYQAELDRLHREQAQYAKHKQELEDPTREYREEAARLQRELNTEAQRRQQEAEHERKRREELEHERKRKAQAHEEQERKRREHEESHQEPFRRLTTDPDRGTWHERAVHGPINDFGE